MKLKSFAPLLVAGAFFMLIPSEVEALNGSGYGGGSGTEGDPYLISTPEHLNQLQLDVNVNGIDTSGIHYRLDRDIDLSSYDNDSDSSNGNFTPIGNSSNAFKGIFDGNGKVISNLKITLPSGDYIGLFGKTYYATIENIGLKNISIEGNDTVGGLIASQEGGLVKRSYTEGIISVTSGGVYSGGLVGYQKDGVITQSYSKSTVKGSRMAAGLVGGVCGGSTITQSYATGSVSGGSDNGGLVGELISDGSQVFESNYWDTQASGQSSSKVGIGLTTQEMISGSAKTNMIGFGFDNTWQITDDYPELRVKVEIPPQDYGGGSGTENNPYLISTPEHLNQLQVDVNRGVVTTNKYYKLMNDIDLSTYDNDSDESNGNFTPIGNSSYQFKGTFDGNGKVISNLKIILPDQNYVGLFGQTIQATVQKLGLENVLIEGKGSIGPLTGYLSNGTLNQSYATGSVNASGQYSGGLVGYQEGSQSVIEQSYSKVNISGTTYVGGLVGYKSATAAILRESYATGKMIGTANVGLIGGTNTMHSGGSNYFRSTVALYWDTKSSGIYTGVYGRGLTTSQMIGENAKDYMTGFDFDNVWEITDSYPKLKWEKEKVVASDERELLLDGMVNPTVLSFILPTEALDFVLDPNQEEGQQFIASEFQLINKSKAPVTVELRTFEQVTDVLNDVIPTKYDSWGSLTQKQSKDFALALVPKVGDGWLTLNEGERWVANLGNTMIGTVKGDSMVSFRFEAKHGLSFNEPLAPQYKLTFVFGLQD